jgi:hypothetical protein
MSPLLRPTLLPGLVRVWRGPHTLQLGLDPGNAVLVDLPDPRAARMLELLDGTRPERLVLARAVECGVAADDARALLDSLHAAGFVLSAPSLLPSSLADDGRRRLTGEAVALALRDRRRAGTPPQPRAGRSPAATLRRRAAARVAVAGRGRLGAAVAVALAEAGVGHVHPDLSGMVGRAELAGGPLTGADVGRPRAEAVADAVAAAAPGVATRAIRRGTASLVVQLCHVQPVALLAAGHAQRGQAHLAVSLREGAAIVGPLVPGAGGPCLNCVDLHRTERDPGWPELAAQLAAGDHEPCGVATLLAAVAYVTGEALTYLDGGTPETLGAAVEITAPGRHRRRTWPPHPACGCTRRRSRPAEGCRGTGGT